MLVEALRYAGPSTAPSRRRRRSRCRQWEPHHKGQGRVEGAQRQVRVVLVTVSRLLARVAAHGTLLPDARVVGAGPPGSTWRRCDGGVAGMRWGRGVIWQRRRSSGGPARWGATHGVNSAQLAPALKVVAPTVSAHVYTFGLVGGGGEAGGGGGDAGGDGGEVGTFAAAIRRDRSMSAAEQPEVSNSAVLPPFSICPEEGGHTQYVSVADERIVCWAGVRAPDRRT